MSVGVLAQAILGFVAVVFLGVVLRLVKVVDRSAARPLNTVIIYIGLPAFVFKAVHGASVRPEMLAVVGVAWVVFAVVLAAAVIAIRVLKLERPRAGGFLLAATLGNTGYIGYPLTGALLGAAAIPTAVFYDVFGTVMQLVLVGFPAARRFGSNEVKGHRFGLLGELATFPALVAAIIALATSGIEVPKPLMDWLASIASMVAPLIMLSVGISLSARAIKHGAVALVALAAIRLLLAPLVAAVAGSVMLADPTAYRTAVLEGSTPAMMLTLAIGERFGLDADFVAAAILVTTVGSVITIPLAQMLLR